MISFNLKCQDGHFFDAWFKDGATFDAQAAGGEVACPFCGNTAIVKAPMAPRIAKGPGAPDPERLRAMQGEMRRRLAEIRDHVEQNCDYVGERFAEEARRIHYGETERRDIYGEATDHETSELADEGVAFARIPWLPRTNS